MTPDMYVPAWRAAVVHVPQGRVTLPGSPAELLAAATAFRAQVARSGGGGNGGDGDGDGDGAAAGGRWLRDIAATTGLPVCAAASAAPAADTVASPADVTPSATTTATTITRTPTTAAARGTPATAVAAAAAAAAGVAAAAMGIPGLLDRPWATLSGGEAARAMLAVCVALRPRVLLLDEVSSGLDAAAAVAVESLVSRVATAGEGVAVLWVSHDAAQMARVGGRVLAFEGGGAGVARLAAAAVVATVVAGVAAVGGVAVGRRRGGPDGPPATEPSAPAPACVVTATGRRSRSSSRPTLFLLQAWRRLTGVGAPPAGATLAAPAVTPAAAPAAAPAAHPMLPPSQAAPPPVGARGLTVAAAAIVMVAGISRVAGLGLETSLLTAAARCGVQLWALGMVLRPLLSSSSPPAVAVALSVMVALAATEATRGIGYTHPRLGPLVAACLAVAAASVTALAVGVVLRPAGGPPPLAARTLLPLAGMLLGSALSAVSVSLSHLLKELVESPSGVETRLALGASRWEATAAAVRGAVRLALRPTVNIMAVAGVIVIPGMATGQLLAGAPPATAMAYQTVILFLITAAAFAATLGAVLGGVTLVVGPDHRLVRAGGGRAIVTKKA
ncbi:hypothetical protein MMPV_003191 [Pyropia vietnamensis]